MKCGYPQHTFQSRLCHLKALLFGICGLFYGALSRLCGFHVYSNGKLIIREAGILFARLQDKGNQSDFVVIYPEQEVSLVVPVP